MRIAIVLIASLAGAVLHAAPAAVSFVQSSDSVDCYDFAEVTINVDRPDAANPFTDVQVVGEFTHKGGEPMRVDGFCDSADGRVLRIRFMPTQPGDYEYAVTYRQGDFLASHSGRFVARKGDRRGLIRVDKEHPWHFLWEGTGEHYFWNSTTTYWLLGWRDEAIIEESLDRLARWGVNRVRVALSGRTRDGTRWKEPDVKPSEQFEFRLEPWPAARPENIEDPGYDVTRFNLDHFRKCERMLDHARKRGLQVSIIFHLDGADKGVDPFGKERMGGEDEQRYYRYTVARLAAFPNVMWDVTNEWHLFRDEAWVEKMGQLVKDCDPYDHLTSVHGKGVFPFRTSPWADFAMYQSWDEHGGYAFMLKNRREQEKTGRPMPQINEEYGYEDHYPYPWGGGRVWPARAADSRRRLVWQITMAGGYQTTGERANVPGCGGWITGRGDDSMVLFEGHRHLAGFFKQMPWWRLNPDNEFFESQGTSDAGPAVVGMRSAEDGLAVLYFCVGGSARIKRDVLPGSLVAKWFNPRSGAYAPAELDPQSSLFTPDRQDWVLLLTSTGVAHASRIPYGLDNGRLVIEGVVAAKPLVVFVGGPLNTVANAYLMDPTIAERMVVFMTDLRGCNGMDPWANHIVATRCKLINYGAHIWWPQRPEPPVMPLARFAELPQNEMTADLHRMAKWFWDRSTKADKPDRDDGFADGAPIFYFFNHKTWLAVQPQKVTAVFDAQDTSDQSYDLLDARKLDYKLMTEDFFRVLKNPAVYGR